MNEEEKQIAGNEGETATPVENVETQTQEETTTTEETTPAENKVDVRTFTQDQVNDLVRERIDRERGSLLKRYGVDSKDALDELVAKAKSYEQMCKNYDDMRQEMAFMENDIEPTKRDDVLTYFKGKNMEFTSEQLNTELGTHPEWRKIVEKSDKPITTITEISPERSVKQNEDEKETVAKLFGIKML